MNNNANSSKVPAQSRQVKKAKSQNPTKNADTPTLPLHKPEAIDSVIKDLEVLDLSGRTDVGAKDSDSLINTSKKLPRVILRVSEPANLETP